MDANQLRKAFTGFFEERDHTVVPSASLIPHDMSVLFTVAGMVPFKPYFVGEEPAPWPRAVSVQKCVRAGGKHNDLDEIGRTKRHLTFFEMLGNFSFGDYFKERAIPLAWEFVTDVLGLDPERLWVTVHTTDDEAEAIWHDVVGLPLERIQRLDEDNFWQMADTGPCGPSSEIFWDMGDGYGEAGGPAHGGEERFVEIWNLVFMQYDQHADGTRRPLPKPSIDTGAGLERILTVLQHEDSIFHTDEFRLLIAKASELTGVAYGAEERTDVSLRILADHARAMTFLVNDGVIPSNEERGYVLRRIIRRAVRHAYLLGVDEVITPVLVDEVVAIMAGDYPELVDSHAVVRQTIDREETRFRETLRTGSAILDTALDQIEPGQALSGDVAFQLHDTYGFPLEVTQEIVAEQGVDVDQAGFDVAMAEQRRRAKANQRKVQGSADALGLDLPETDFVGRERNEIDSPVLAVLDNEGDAIIVLAETPFYAESGGQVGDTGSITTGTGRAQVTDTTYGPPGIVFHHASVDGEIEVGQVAHAAIDVERRDAIRRNHTGTHILHWALREVLGDHVKQQGSLVAPDRLRFDFSHFEPVTAEQIAAIEDLANREILTDAEVKHTEMDKEAAEALGAIAFFGDKYGDRVRVLEAGPHSTEFCGGTHVTALGQIGPVKIVSEGSIGSNLRRVEAVTGLGTVDRLRRDEDLLSGAADRLGVAPDELVTGIDKRLEELKALRDEVKALKRQTATGQAGALATAAVDGVVVARVDGLDRDGLRDLAVAVRDTDGVRAVVIIGEPDGGGVGLVAAVTPDSGLNAGELIADAAKTVGGGGGKAPDLAVAGGRDPAKIDDALDQARDAAGLS
ncbi:MAG TPA: alanine--tRNA ligase [Acidimicrobiales bacterium]